jgi:hypothetical protein
MPLVKPIVSGSTYVPHAQTAALTSWPFQNSIENLSSNCVPNLPLVLCAWCKTRHTRNILFRIMLGQQNPTFGVANISLVFHIMISMSWHVGTSLLQHIILQILHAPLILYYCCLEQLKGLLQWSNNVTIQRMGMVEVRSIKKVAAC